MQRERENKSVLQAEMFSLFSVSDVFADAKVMLLLRIMMLLTYVRNDAMLAHCAEGTTSFTK